MAVHDPLSKEFNIYIENTFAKNKVSAPSLINVALEILENDDVKKEDWNETKALFGSILSRMIDEGSVFDVSTFTSAAKYIELSQGNTSIAIQHPKRLFGDKRLLTRLVGKYESNMESLLKVAKAVQVMDHGYVITSLMIQPQPSAKFSFQNGTQVSGQEISGLAWLKVISQLNQDDLALSWRGVDGVVRQGIIAKVENLKSSQYQFSFDEDILRNLTYREFDLNDI